MPSIALNNPLFIENLQIKQNLGFISQNKQKVQGVGFEPTNL
jgi:hypothetical protein